MPIDLSSVSRWLVGLMLCLAALSVSTRVAAQFSGANPDSRHSLDWCWEMSSGSVPWKLVQKSVGSNAHPGKSGSRAGLDGGRQSKPCGHEHAVSELPSVLGERVVSDHDPSCRTDGRTVDELLRPGNHRRRPCLVLQRAVDGSAGDRCPVRLQCKQSDNVPDLVGVGTDSRCYCRAPFEWAERIGGCYRIEVVDRTKTTGCNIGGSSIGNPIFPVTGTKRETVETGIALGPLALEITYDSSRIAPVSR